MDPESRIQDEFAFGVVLRLFYAHRGGRLLLSDFKGLHFP